MRNGNKPQRYGTQVQYNTEQGIAFPKDLEDPENVDKRRSDIGMESLDDYLEKVTSLHREVNREHYEKLGILKPKNNK